MSVIALREYSDNIQIAADGRGTGQGRIITDTANKILEIDEWVLGICGWGDIVQLFKIELTKEKQYKPITSLQSYVDFIYDFYRQKNLSLAVDEVYVSTFLINKKTEKIYKSIGVECFEIDGYDAIGSGQEIALGALAAGATPHRAVEIACEYLPDCGGKIQQIRIEGKKRPYVDFDKERLEAEMRRNIYSEKTKSWQSEPVNLKK